MEVQGLLWKCKKGVTGSSWKKNWVFCDGEQFLQWGGNMRPDKSEEPKYSLELVECTIKENESRSYAFEIIDNFTKKSMIFAANDANQFQKWWNILTNPIAPAEEPASPRSSPKKATFADMLLSPFFKSTAGAPDGEAEEGEYDEEYEEEESRDLTAVSKYAKIILKYFQQQDNHPVPFHSLHALIAALDPYLIPSRVLHFIAQQLQYPSLESLVTFEEFVTIWMLFEHVFIPLTKEQCFEYYIYPTSGTPHPNTTTFYGRTSHSNVSYICPMMFRIHIPTTLLSGYQATPSSPDSPSGYQNFQDMEELIQTSSTKILQQLAIATGSATAKSHSNKKPYDWYGIYSSYLIQVQKNSLNYHQYVQSLSKPVDFSIFQQPDGASTVQGTVTDQASHDGSHQFYQQQQKEKLIELFQYNHQERFEKQQAFDEILLQSSVSLMALWHCFHIMAMQGCELFIQEYTLPNHLKSMIPISLSLQEGNTNAQNIGLNGLLEERGVAKGILGSTSSYGVPLPTATNVNSTHPTNTQPQLAATNRMEIMSHLYLQERIYEYHGIYLYSYTLQLVDPSTSSPSTAASSSNGPGDHSSMSWNSSNMSMFQRMYCKANEIYQKIYLTEWKNYLVLQREYDHVWMEELLITRYCPHLQRTEDQDGKDKDTTYTEDAHSDEDEEDDEEEGSEDESGENDRGRKRSKSRVPLRDIMRPVKSDHHPATNQDRSYSPTRNGVPDMPINESGANTPYQPPNGYHEASLDEMLLRRRFITMIDYSGYRMIAYVPTPSAPKVTPINPDFEDNPHQNSTIQQVMQRIIHKLQERLHTINPLSFSSFTTTMINPFAVEEPSVQQPVVNYDGILPTPVNALSTGMPSGPPVPKKFGGYFFNNAHILSPDLFPVHTPDILTKQLRKELVFSFAHLVTGKGNAKSLLNSSPEDTEDEEDYADEGNEDEEADNENEEEEQSEHELVKKPTRSKLHAKFVNVQQFLQNEESQTAVNHAHYSGGAKKDNREHSSSSAAATTTEITPETITPWISLCHHLYSNIIPTFLHHLDHYLHIHSTSSLTSISSSTPYGLSQLMHRYGLNVHHLGVLYSLTTNAFHKQFFLTEMIARSVKVVYQMLITNYLEKMYMESRLAILRKKSSLLQFQEFNQLINEYRQEIILLLMNYFFPASQIYTSTSTDSSNPSNPSIARQRETQESNLQRIKVFLQQEEFANMLIDIIYNKFGVMLTNPNSVKNEYENQQQQHSHQYDEDGREEPFSYFGESRDPKQQYGDSMKDTGEGEGIDANKRTKSSSKSKSTSHHPPRPPPSMLYASHWLDHMDLHPMNFFHSIQYHLSCQFKDIVYTTKLHPKKFQNPSNIPFLPSDIIHFFLPVIHTQQSDEEEMGYWDISLSSHYENHSISTLAGSPTKYNSAQTGRTGGGSGYSMSYQPHSGLSTSLPEWLLSSGLTNHPLRSTVTLNPLPESAGAPLSPHWSKLGELGHQIGLVGYGSNIDYFFGLTYVSSFLHNNMMDEVYILIKSYYYLKVPLYHHLLSTITPTPSTTTASDNSTANTGKSSKSSNATGNVNTGGKNVTTAADKTYLPKLPWQQVYAFAQITYTYLTICFQCQRYEECHNILQYYLGHPYTQYHSFLPTSAILTLSLHYYYETGTTITTYPNGIPSGRGYTRRDAATWQQILTTYNLLDQLYYSSAFSLLPSKHVANTTAIFSLVSFYESHSSKESFLQGKILLLLLKSCWEKCLLPSSTPGMVTSNVILMKNGMLTASTTVPPNRYSGVSYMLAYISYRLGKIYTRLQDPTNALSYFQQAYAQYYQFTSPQSTFSATSSSAMLQQNQHSDDQSVSAASGRSSHRSRSHSGNATLPSPVKGSGGHSPLAIETGLSESGNVRGGGDHSNSVGPLYPVTLVGRGNEPVVHPHHNLPPHLITSTPLYPTLTASSSVGKFIFSVALSRKSTPLYYDAMCILFNIGYLQYHSQRAIPAAIHTLTHLIQYYTHYSQLTHQLSLFQQYYTDTTLQLVTGNNPALYRFHVKHTTKTAGKEHDKESKAADSIPAVSAMAGTVVNEDIILRKIKVVLTEEMKELMLSSYLLLIECYERNQDYDFAMDSLQSLLWFIHVLILSFTPLPRSPSNSYDAMTSWMTSQPPVGLDYPTIFASLPNRLANADTSSAGAFPQVIDTAILLPLYSTLNHKLLNNVILTYSHTTRHLLASIAQEYTARNYHSHCSLLQQQSLVQLQYLSYEECILLTVNFFIDVWWNHWLVEYMEGLIRRVVEVEQRFDEYEEDEEGEEEEYFYGDFIVEDDEEGNDEEYGEDDGEERGYGSAIQRRRKPWERELEDDEKNYVVKNRPPEEKPKLITRCYLCDDRLVEDYLVTRPPPPKTTTHLLIQSLATQSTNSTRLQRILGRRRRNTTSNSTVTSTLLQSSRMSREEMKELRRCLPLYAQVYVVYLLLQQPTQFAYYVSQLYSLPPSHYEPPQFA